MSKFVSNSVKVLERMRVCESGLKREKVRGCVGEREIVEARLSDSEREDAKFWESGDLSPSPIQAYSSLEIQHEFRHVMKEESEEDSGSEEERVSLEDSSEEEHMVHMVRMDQEDATNMGVGENADTTPVYVNPGEDSEEEQEGHLVTRQS